MLYWLANLGLAGGTASIAIPAEGPEVILAMTSAIELPLTQVSTSTCDLASVTGTSVTLAVEVDND